MNIDGGTLIVLIVVLIIFFAAAYGLYGRRGSQITAHPQSSESPGGAPGTGRPTATDEYEERAVDADRDRER